MMGEHVSWWICVMYTGIMMHVHIHVYDVLDMHVPWCVHMLWFVTECSIIYALSMCVLMHICAYIVMHVDVSCDIS